MSMQADLYAKDDRVVTARRWPSGRTAAVVALACLACLALVAAGCGDDAEDGRYRTDREPGEEGHPAPVGSAELQTFITVGHLEHTDEVQEAAGGVELGTGEAVALAAFLEEHWPRQPGVPPPERDELGPALSTAPPEGMLGFGFLSSGCGDTSAELWAGDGPVHAVVSGGEGVHCDAPEYYLATFHVPEDDLLPEDAVLD